MIPNHNQDQELSCLSSKPILFDEKQTRKFTIFQLRSLTIEIQHCLLCFIQSCVLVGIVCAWIFQSLAETQLIKCTGNLINNVTELKWLIWPRNVVHLLSEERERLATFSSQPQSAACTLAAPLCWESNTRVRASTSELCTSSQTSRIKKWWRLLPHRTSQNKIWDHILNQYIVQQLLRRDEAVASENEWSSSLTAILSWYGNCCTSLATTDVDGLLAIGSLDSSNSSDILKATG